MSVVERRWVLTTLRQLFMIASFVLGFSAIASTASFAAANEYRFELAGPAVKPGKTKTTIVKIRLIHVPDGKAVAGAIIIQSVFDMAPQKGMAAMMARGKAVATSEPGIYQIQGEPEVDGMWTLNLAAKVQGEAETVRGSVSVEVPK